MITNKPFLYTNSSSRGEQLGRRDENSQEYNKLKYTRMSAVNWAGRRVQAGTSAQKLAVI